MSDDWASKAAQRLKDSEERKRQNDAYDVQARNAVMSHAPILWEDLKATIRLKASQFNEAYGDSYLTISPPVQEDFTVGSSYARLALHFKTGVPCVSHKLHTGGTGNPWVGGQTSQDDLLIVYDRNQVWFIKKGESGTYKTVEQAAEYLLSMVIKP